MPWVKGQSGNPSGKPKEDAAVREAKELARAKSPDAVLKLIALMDSADEKVSLAACNSVLDRGLGKPVQAIVGDDENPLRFAGIELHIVDHRAQPEPQAAQNEPNPEG